MAGHSKWANIKRQKNAQDKARGKLFSKLSKLITNAVKEGGSPDPDKNVQLRQAIDRAKEEDMPKDNIERAIKNALKKAESTQDIVLEGYGPFGLAVLIQAATDNRQRTVQEIKNIFESHGGNLAEPGSVAYKFYRQGRVVVKKPEDEKILKLIDLGADDIEEKEESVDVFLKPEKLNDFIQRAEEDYQIIESGIELVAQERLGLNKGQEEEAEKFANLIEKHPDVEKVFTNV